MVDWENITLKDLAGYLSEELSKEGIDLILVGGACVTIYTNNRYQSYDLDFITYEDLRKVKKVLKKHGFIERARYFRHENCPWIVEFVSPPVAVGGEPVHEFSFIKTKMGTVKLLRPIDSVKDRLANFFHWNDRQALQQAVNICQEKNREIDYNELKRWSQVEGHSDKFREFLVFLENEGSSGG